MEKLESVINFIQNHKPNIQKQCNDYKFDGLNLFEIISDKYHYENLHSDVLNTLLSPEAAHKEGNKYLILFIDFLNQYKNHTIKFNPNSVFNVNREQGRRDLTITADKQAIIIENKINNAADTSNQIPTYYYQLKENDYEILAIVYLTLDQGKEPNKTSWEIKSEEDRKDIENKLISVRVFDGTKYDLISGWLNPCIEQTNDCNTLSVLRQYKATLFNLSQNLLDMDFMEEFKTFLEKDDNFELISNIKANFERLPEYVGLKFKEHFSKDEKYKPFESINMNGIIPFFKDYRIEGYSFNTDVIFNLQNTTIDFSIRQPNSIVYTKEIPKLLLNTIGISSDFEWNNNGRFIHIIKGDIIKSEKEAKEYTEKFLKLLIDKKDEIEIKLKEDQQI